MSETPEPKPLGPTLFQHALRLHQQNPDSPLPRDGEWYPDNDRHRRRRGPRKPEDPRLWGGAAAAILDRHFGSPDAPPSELVDAFHDVDVPIHENQHITAAAWRANRRRVQQTGRWLVRHSTDRCSALVGLALLATDRADEDIPLIQTIGLLSNSFGALAAKALSRRRVGNEDDPLLWLARRVSGWGRVYVIEELIRYGAWEVREWLLRHACEGDFLDGYFAGKVATQCHLHEAITGTDIDDDLVDHTGRLLSIMAECAGMGMSLRDYPPAPIVLAAHAAHRGRQTPTTRRYVNSAFIADRLAENSPEENGCTTEQRDDIVRQYRAMLDRPDWRETAPSVT